MTTESEPNSPANNPDGRATSPVDGELPPHQLLRQARRHEAALIQLTRKDFLENPDWMASLRFITETAAEAMEVARVSIWLRSPGNEEIECVELFDRRDGSHSSGMKLKATDCPAYFEAIRHLDVIAADDAQTDSRTSGFTEAYLRPMGITSMMDATIGQNGHSLGVLCNEHIGPIRQWTPDERAFAIAIANLVCLVYEKRDRREAEQALRQSEQRFREISESIDQVFWLMDAETTETLYVSPAYERIWGQALPQGRCNAETWISHIHPEDRQLVRAALRELAVKDAISAEYRLVQPDGSIRWVRNRAFIVKNSEAKRRRITGVATDVTESRQLEIQLRQAQKMEAVGRLAGGVAHDFNNLLAVVLMRTALLQDDPYLSQEARDGIDEISACAQRAANLTRQLLTFSRRQIKRAQCLDLSETIGGMMKLLRRVIGEDILLAAEISANVPRVHADPGMIEQVLMNLAVNARDAMPSGGSLRIGLAPVMVDEEGLALHPQAAAVGEYACLSVIDTGCGIPAANLTRIWEPFFTTKEVGKGTGLGLATVFGIVQEHGGWIHVESKAGEGAAFHIYLPAFQPEPVAEPAPEQPRSSSGTETILLVEDEDRLRTITSQVLSRAGYRVIEAASGPEALVLWRQCPGRIDLVLTDLVLPGGMSGRELAETLRASAPDLKVLYTSGYSSDLVSRNLGIADSRDFLQKPCSMDHMIASVRRILDGPGAAVPATSSPLRRP